MRNSFFKESTSPNTLQKTCGQTLQASFATETLAVQCRHDLFYYRAITFYFKEVLIKWKKQMTQIDKKY